MLCWETGIYAYKMLKYYLTITQSKHYMQNTTGTLNSHPTIIISIHYYLSGWANILEFQKCKLTSALVL